MKNLKRLLQYFNKYKLWTVLGSTLIFFEVIMDLFLPTIMADIVNHGIQNQDTNYIIVQILIMLGLSIIGILGGIFSTYYSAKVSSHVSSDIRESILKKVSELSFFEIDQISVGHIVTVITNDILLIGEIFMMGIRILFRVPIILVGSLIMAILISPKLSIILLIVLPLMLVLVFLVIKKAYPYFDATQKAVDDVNSVVRENVNGIRTIKSTVREEEEINKFKQVNQRLLQVNLKAMRIMTIAMPMMMMIINFSTIVVLWLGRVEILNGHTEIGNIMAFIQYLTNMLSAVMIGSIMIVMLSKSEVSASRVNQILFHPSFEYTGKNKDSLSGKIEFHHVDFSYEKGSGDAVLHDINFTIQPGEKIGLIGSTGSGKSTLIHLISGFYETTGGKILLDDREISTFDFTHLRKEIGISFQKPYLFCGTISDNIMFGKSFDLNHIEQVSQVSCSDEITNKRENGILGIVEQKGNNFSGGEKQRISLARTLYRDPSILLLDDTTSALDFKTEEKVLKQIRTLFSDRTILLISSRVASLLSMDKIMVLEDGKLVGFDTPESLLLQNSYYQEIYYSQVREEV